MRWYFALLVFLLPLDATAHLGLTQPVSRYGPNVLKDPPCGRAGGQRGQNVFTFMAGQTIELRWDEYIDHPGHFRVSFDDDGDDDFVDPPCLANCNSTNPTVEFYSNNTVLMDNIPDQNGGTYSVLVTLPNVECTNCTLQVIQVMYDKPPYTIPGNEMYYQCVDLILTAPQGNDAGTMDEGVIDVGSITDLGAAKPDLGQVQRTDMGDFEPEKASCVCVQAQGEGLLIFFLLAAAGCLRRWARESSSKRTKHRRI